MDTAIVAIIAIVVLVAIFLVIWRRRHNIVTTEVVSTYPWYYGWWNSWQPWTWGYWNYGRSGSYHHGGHRPLRGGSRRHR